MTKYIPVRLQKKPAKKKKLTSIPNLKKKLWSLCRAITEKKYPNRCYTCDRPVEGSNRQLGHCIPSSIGGANCRYHLDNLRWQCYNCNINCGGQGAEYYKRLVKEIGQERVDDLFDLKEKNVSAGRYFYTEHIEDYTRLLLEA
jgi:NAD-dependent DNA ligase